MLISKDIADKLGLEGSKPGETRIVKIYGSRESETSSPPRDKIVEEAKSKEAAKESVTPKATLGEKIKKTGNLLWDALKAGAKNNDPSANIRQGKVAALNRDDTVFAQMVRDQKAADAARAAEEAKKRSEAEETAKSIQNLQKTYNSQKRELENAQRTLSNMNAVDNSEAKKAVEKRLKEAQTAIEFTRQEMQDIGGRAEDAGFLERAGKVITGSAKNIAATNVNAAGTVIAQDAARRDFLIEEEASQAQKDYDRAKADYEDAVAEFGEDSADAGFAANILAEAEKKLKEEDVFIGGGTSDRTTSDKLEATADRLAASGANDLEDAKRGASRAGQIAVDVGSQALALGGDALLNVLAPGLGMAAFDVRAFGGASQKARLAGADENQQMLYGLASSALEMLTEKMFDGVAAVYGKGAADDLIEQAIARLCESDAGRTALRTLANMGGEGAEEIISSLADPVLQMIYDPNAVKAAYGDPDSVKNALGDALYDGFIGAALGGFGSAVELVNGQNAAKNAALRGYTAENALPDASQMMAEAAGKNAEAPTVENTMPENEKIISEGKKASIADKQARLETLKENAEKARSPRLKGAYESQINALESEIKADIKDYNENPTVKKENSPVEPVSPASEVKTEEAGQVKSAPEEALKPEKVKTGNLLWNAIKSAGKNNDPSLGWETDELSAANIRQSKADALNSDAAGKVSQETSKKAAESAEKTVGENIPAESGNGGTGENAAGETARTQSSFKDNNLTKEERKIPGYTEEEQVHTVLKDKELKSRAEARVDADADGVLKELAGKPVKDWDADDIEASNVLIRRNMDEARALKKAGKTAEAAEVYKKLAPLVQTRESKGTKTGQELRLFGLSLENSVAKLSNKLFGDNQTERAKKMSDEEKVKIVTEAERLTDKFNSTELGDADGLIEIIKETAKLRNNVSHKSKEIGTAIEKYMRQAAKTEDGRTWLKAVAESNIRNMSLDYDDIGFEKGARAIRYNMMLSGMHTFFSNVGGNTVFGSLMEPLANNASIPIDRLLSTVTGVKTVGADAGMLSPKWYKGFIDGAKRGIVESYLDAFTTEDGKYDSQQQRTYKMTGNAWERFWSNSENISDYRMYATDQAAKGATLGTLKPFYEKQVKRGKMTAELMNELLAYEEQYRTFQYDSELTKGGMKVREGVDVIHGLGTSVVPFARIAANVTSASLDYNSMFSFMNGLFEIGKLAKAQKEGNALKSTKVKQKSAKALEAAMAQHKAAKAFGRGITSAGMTVGFMALKGLGVLKDYRDDDYDAEKQSGAEGRKGIQINYSALGRVIAAAKNGEDWKAAAEEREGDNFGGLEFLPPLNGLAYMGSMMYDAYTDEEVNELLGYAGAYAGATAQSTKNAFLDFPAVSTISNFISGVKSNKAAFTPENATDADRNKATAKAYGVTALETGADILLSNVIPAKVKGIAKGIDSVERSTNSTDWKQKIGYKIKSQIPKWREQVPAKMDAYGNEIKNEGGIRNFINKNLLAEPVVSHTQTEVSKKVEEVYKATGDAAVNPDFYPPKKLTFTVGKEKTEYKLNDEQQRQYQYIRGQTMQMYVQEALDKGKFDGLSDDEQAELIKDIKNLSNDIAKQEFAKDAKFRYDTKYKMESALQDPVSYLTANVQISSDYEAKGKEKPSQGRELFENYLYYGIKGKDADTLAEKNLGKKNLGAYTVMRNNNKRPQDIMEMLDAWDIITTNGTTQDAPDGNYNQASVYKGLSGLNIPDSDKSKIWNFLLGNPKTQYSNYRAK